MLSVTRSILRVVKEAGFQFPGEAGAPWCVVFPAGPTFGSKPRSLRFSTTASAAAPVPPPGSGRASQRLCPLERVPLGLPGAEPAESRTWAG